MDPLSLAAGVTDILALTSQTMNITRNYVNEVKHGKKTATYILQELGISHRNLAGLGAFLEDDSKRGSHVLMIPRYWCHAREASETGSQRQLQSLRKDSRRFLEKYDPSSGH